MGFEDFTGIFGVSFFLEAPEKLGEKNNSWEFPKGFFTPLKTNMTI